MIILQRSFIYIKNYAKYKFIYNINGFHIRQLNAHRHEEWKLPEGHDTGLIIYNSVTKSKVPFIANKNKIVKWYTCGPTVYNDAHIGHASCYMRFDIMKRILESQFQLQPVVAMSITDIDDKTIKRARELKMSVSHLSKQYEKSFFSDMAKLGIKRPDLILRVTAHIPHIIHFCQGILDKGFAYPAQDGSLYFDSAKYMSPGVLRSQENMNQEEGEVNHPGKRSPQDFALWKGAKPDEPWWEAPWGKGRPGWHVECSAMASEVFGSNMDIHSGGLDLQFPHHENEISQSHAFHGCADRHWVNYWIHPGLLNLLDEVKMSKSLGNTVSIDEYLRHYSAEDLRLLCLRTHYRHPIEFSEKNMNEVLHVRKKIDEFLAMADSYVMGRLDFEPLDEPALIQRLLEVKQEIAAALADDFNTPHVIHVILELIHDFHTQMKPHVNSSASARTPLPMVACQQLIVQTLCHLGMQSAPTSDDTLSTLQSGVDILMEFRANVRHYALSSGPSFPKPSVASPAPPTSVGDGDPIVETPDWTTRMAREPSRKPSPPRHPILTACDEVRWNLEAIGIKVKDHSKAASTWSLHKPPPVATEGKTQGPPDLFDPEYHPHKKF